MTKMTKGVSLDAMLDRLPATRRAKVEAGTRELVKREMVLREIRKIVGKTQTTVAKSMGVTQGEVSRIESQPDLLIMTLGRYMEGLGLHLEMSVRLPDGETVRLPDWEDFGTMEGLFGGEIPKPKGRPLTAFDKRQQKIWGRTPSLKKEPA